MVEGPPELMCVGRSELVKIVLVHAVRIDSLLMILKLAHHFDFSRFRALKRSVKGLVRLALSSLRELPVHCTSAANRCW